MVQLFRTSLFIALFSFIFNFQASAKMPVFFQVGAEHVYKAQDLPDTDYFQLEDGTYMDLGVFSKQFTIFFIPLWNYDVEWCGYVGNDDELITLTEENLTEIAQEAGITIAETPSLPFWPSIGGKLLFLVIIGGFIGFSVMSSQEEGEEDLDEEGQVVPKFGPAVEETAPLTEVPPTEEGQEEPKV